MHVGYGAIISEDEHPQLDLLNAPYQAVTRACADYFSNGE